MKHCFVGLLFLALAIASPAAAEDQQVVEIWTCTLKDGKTIEE